MYNVKNYSIIYYSILCTMESNWIERREKAAANTRVYTRVYRSKVSINHKNMSPTSASTFHLDLTCSCLQHSDKCCKSAFIYTCTGNLPERSTSRHILWATHSCWHQHSQDFQETRASTEPDSQHQGWKLMKHSLGNTFVFFSPLVLTSRRYTSSKDPKI